MVKSNEINFIMENIKLQKYSHFLPIDNSKNKERKIIYWNKCSFQNEVIWTIALNDFLQCVYLCSVLKKKKAQ